MKINSYYYVNFLTLPLAVLSLGGIFHIDPRGISINIMFLYISTTFALIGIIPIFYFKFNLNKLAKDDNSILFDEYYIIKFDKEIKFLSLNIDTALFFALIFSSILSTIPAYVYHYILFSNMENKENPAYIIIFVIPVFLFGCLYFPFKKRKIQEDLIITKKRIIHNRYNKNSKEVGFDYQLNNPRFEIDTFENIKNKFDGENIHYRKPKFFLYIQREYLVGNDVPKYLLLQSGTFDDLCHINSKIQDWMSSQNNK